MVIMITLMEEPMAVNMVMSSTFVHVFATGSACSATGL